MVTPHLLRLVGERMARYLLLTGELIDADQACRSGLINLVVPSGELLERAHALCKSLAPGGPNALAKTKEVLQTQAQRPLSPEETAKLSAEPRTSEECRQGLTAFFAKKNPPWV
jgi:methylglutaconyl-CoA hydratase